MNYCSIVRDVLPLYVEDLLSEDTKAFVDEHILTCDECQKELELAQKNSNSKNETNDETILLKKVQQNLKFKRLKIACISILVTAIICITGVIIINKLGLVSDAVATPYQVMNIQETSIEWTLLQSDFSYDSRKYSRTIVNDAKSDAPIEIRILDSKDEIIIPYLHIEPGQISDLSLLKYNKEYKIYAKTECDMVILKFW